MGGWQAVVFLLLNEREGKDEVKRRGTEARDTLLQSRVSGLAMENIMGQDSFYCIYKVSTEN